MKNRFNKEVARDIVDNLEMRVYTSQILGQDSNLVLHGGGNTSFKDSQTLHVKGSGWNLDTIAKEGFSPVSLMKLAKMATLESLSDSDMVKQQREALRNPKAPNPSVEAILHAIIPFCFVDHTHSDAVVTISNTPEGEKLIKELYPNFMIIPYVMPGFILAKEIYEYSLKQPFDSVEGIILLNHGIFTYDDDAETSYNKMIDAVNIAEKFLDEKAPLKIEDIETKEFDYESLKEILSSIKGYECVVKVNSSPLAKFFASQKNVNELSKKGILTPEHIIRTKRYPMLIDEDIPTAVATYVKEYMEYFNSHKKDETMLNPAPMWAVIKGVGTVSFGKNEKEANIIEDINNHTMKAILQAEQLGGFESISVKDGFEMEYWELEQAKLKK
ncbi:MAG: class II aldolase/adducin family protein [Campylobacterota bacterium]|nr:class II aldolase/adducin family protein [Campylobacterota bacterium]